MANAEEDVMRNPVSQAVMILLMAAVIYTGWYAGFWQVMNTWDMRTWTIFFLSMLVAWIGRDEFGPPRS